MRQVIMYSMKGCPWCDKMKNALKESNIKYRERDIDEYKKEYDMFVEATDNDFVPAFMILDVKNGDINKVKLMAPDRDYDDIPEAIEKLKQFL